MKKYSTRNTILFVLVMVISFGVWWSFKFQKNDKTEEKKEITKTISAKEESENAKNDIVQKLNKYAQCFNRNNSRAHDSYNRYLSWADKDKGPTGKERNIYGLYTIYGSEYYCDKMEETLKMSPKTPSLDEKAKKYVKEMEGLHILLQRADKYYDHQDYKDDNFAGAKELHPILMGAFKEYFDASADFAREFALFSVSTSDLNGWEVNSKNIIQNAIKLHEFVQKTSVNKADFPDIVKKYGEAVEEVELNNPTFVKEKSSFMAAANEFLKLSKALNRDVQSGKGADKYQYQSWKYQYASLVQTYNSLGDKHLKLLEM